jgi:hypothetical protein
MSSSFLLLSVYLQHPYGWNLARSQPAKGVGLQSNAGSEMKERLILFSFGGTQVLTLARQVLLKPHPLPF